MLAIVVETSPLWLPTRTWRRLHGMCHCLDLLIHNRTEAVLRQQNPALNTAVDLCVSGFVLDLFLWRSQRRSFFPEIP